MKKEIKIGLIVIASFLMVYWGSTFLDGTNPFKEKQDYYAYYKNVNGLNVSNSVRYQGFKVGMVQAITYDATKNSWLVAFTITEKSLILKDSTLAMIASSDILGSMIVDLKNIEKGKNQLKPGAFLLTGVEKGLQEAVDERLRPLIVKMESLIGSVDSVVKVVTIMLDEGTVNNIHEAFDKIPLAMENILSITSSADSVMNKLERAKIEEVISNLASITDNLKGNNKEITGILKNFKNISDSLAQANVKQTFDDLSSVVKHLDQIVTEADSGKGTIGMLLNDDKLYKDLSSAAANLDKLIVDVNENPRRYINLSLIGKGNRPTKDEKAVKESKKKK